MRRLYESTITSIGSQVADCLENNMFVLFADFSPPDLLQMAVGHSHVKPPHYLFRPGDLFCVGEVQLEVLAVGEAVMRTFKGMGHCTVRMRPRNKPGRILPGDLIVAGEPPVLEPGMTLQVLRQAG